MITVTAAGVCRYELALAICLMESRREPRCAAKLDALRSTTPAIWHTHQRLVFGRPVHTGERRVITPEHPGFTPGDHPLAAGGRPGDHPESEGKTRWGKSS